MPNVTLSISEEVHNRMKMRSEIRWSDVVRKSIVEKLNDLEMMDKLTQKSRLSIKDVNAISTRIDRNVAKKLGLK